MKYLAVLTVIVIVFAQHLAQADTESVPQTSASIAAVTNIEDPWLVMPGTQVGPITKQTTEADLIRMYGSNNVKDTPIHQGEGIFEAGTTIFPDDPTRTLKILWQDKAHKQNPVQLIVSNERSSWVLDENGMMQQADNSYVKNDKSVWHTSEGITMGTTIRELEQLNAKPFLMSAHTQTCAAPGIVNSWNGGKMESKPHYVIRFGQDEWDNSLDNGGKEEILSDHFRVRKSNLKVVELIFNVGNEWIEEPAQQQTQAEQ